MGCGFRRILHSDSHDRRASLLSVSRHGHKRMDLGGRVVTRIGRVIDRHLKRPVESPLGEPESSIVWLATATDLFGEWTVPTEPVLVKGDTGEWDDEGVLFPSVLTTEGVFEERAIRYSVLIRMATSTLAAFRWGDW